MKQYVTHGTGSAQTLSEVQNTNVVVYDTKADAEADLSNLSEGQIVATKDSGDELAQPVDVIASGNMHAVTSNAVASSNAMPVDQVALNNLHSVTSNAVYPIKEKADILYDTNLLNQIRSLPLVRWEELPSQATNDSTYFQEWYDWMIDHGYFGSGTESYIGLANPNFFCTVWGFTYEGVNVKNYSSFVALKPTSIVRFGYYGGQWYCTGIH